MSRSPRQSAIIYFIGLAAPVRAGPSADALHRIVRDPIHKGRTDLERPNPMAAVEELERPTRPSRVEGQVADDDDGDGRR